MPDSPANSTTERPIRRISSWKVLGIFCLACFLVLLGVVFIPWDVSVPDAPDLEFKPLKLVPETNAFTCLESAGKMQITEFVLPDGKRHDGDRLLYPIGSSGEFWELKFAEEVLTNNVSVFPELEKGIACQQYESPPLKEFPSSPWLEHYHHLTELLCLKSKHAQIAGDYTGATRAGLQGLQLSRLVTENPGFVGEWMTGIICQRKVMERLEEIAADAKTPETMLTEIHKELNQQKSMDFARYLRKALQGEYAHKPNLLNIAVRDNNRLLIAYAYKPNMTRRLIAAYCRHIIANADQSYDKIKPDYPEMFKQPESRFGKMVLIVHPNSAGRMMFSTMSHSPVLALSYHASFQSYVAALRLKVALRLYEIKHDQLPDDLNALVPEFIQEVPKDPYDGRPYRYSKAEKKVWAIGRDLLDQGGKIGDPNRMMDNTACWCDQVMQIGTRELAPRLVPFKSPRIFVDPPRFGDPVHR